VLQEFHGTELAELAGQVIHLDYLKQAQQDPLLQAKYKMAVEAARDAGQLAPEDAQQFIKEEEATFGRRVGPLEQQLLAAPDKQAALAGWRADAERRGLSWERYVEARNNHARDAFSPQLNPTMANEVGHREVLALFGRKPLPGRSAHETAVDFARALCQPAAKEVPFGPRIGPEQRIARELAAHPRAAAWFKSQGVNPVAFIREYGSKHDAAATIDIARWRGEERDARLPRLPREEFNESKDRKSDIRDAFARHGADDPREVAGLGGRRRTIANSMDLDVRAAYAEEEQKTSGQPLRESVEDFKREHWIPKSVRDEYQEVDPGADDDEPSSDGDDRRSDLERAFAQHGG
jgi:hypothetical protein